VNVQISLRFSYKEENFWTAEELVASQKCCLPMELGAQYNSTTVQQYNSTHQTQASDNCICIPDRCLHALLTFQDEQILASGCRSKGRHGVKVTICRCVCRGQRVAADGDRRVGHVGRHLTRPAVPSHQAAGQYRRRQRVLSPEVGKIQIH
jgi:hypothetical protein